MYGQEYPLDLSLSFGFETAADAESFLDGYIGTLMEDSYDIINPKTAGINKNIAYAKEEGSTLWLFGFDYVDGSTTVNVEFRVAEVLEID